VVLFPKYRENGWKTDESALRIDNKSTKNVFHWLIYSKAIIDLASIREQYNSTCGVALFTNL
jgi:hypothetical protein